MAPRSFIKGFNVRRFIVTCLAILASHVAFAEQGPVVMPSDTKLVVFSFDANDTYTVMTMPGTVTDIQIGQDEQFVNMALGDTVQWEVAQQGNHVFVKPKKPNLFTSATLITSKRSYQLTLRSSPFGGKWMQRVSWQYPDILLFQQQMAEAAKDNAVKEQQRVKAQVVSESANPIQNLNFDYSIKGEASFKPAQVFDDGKFTWLRLPPNVPVMPSLFVKDGDKYQLLTYHTDGKNLIKTDRLFDKAVLKLNDQEVEITNQAAKPVRHGSLFSWN